MDEISWRALHLASKVIVRQRLDLQITGKEFLPASGPVIVAARHYHHLYDGCILLATIERPAHILVGLDWVKNRLGRRALTAACRAAAWPMIYRPDSPYRSDRHEPRMMLQGTRDALRLLQANRILIVFPEAYPNIDPGVTMKTAPDDFLPFRPGFARFARLAAQRGLTVPIVPAGFFYHREQDGWHVALRFGPPMTVSASGSSPADLARIVQEQVEALSTPETSVPA
ncbi:MAG TPA: lysophospholipid acyltransferase family protein [Thermomicrobiales bacterium]